MTQPEISQTPQPIRKRSSGLAVLFDLPRLLMITAGLGALLGAIDPVIIHGYLTYFMHREINRVGLIIVGFLLLFLSYQIAQRKKIAWYASIVTLVALLIMSSILVQPLAFLIYVISLFFLIAKRDEFVVMNDYQSARRTLKIFIWQIVIVLVYSILLFVILDQHEFGRDLSGKQTAVVTYDTLAGHKHIPYGVRLSDTDHLFIILLQSSLLVGVLLGIWNLFRPIILSSPGSALERAHAREILRKYPDSSEDFFKVYPYDKHYYFYSESFFAFRVEKGVALILDGAAGNPALFGTLRARFSEYCRLNGWSISVIHSSQSEAEVWSQMGLTTFLIGSEALVDTEVFVTKTLRSKHFRYISNRAAKSGIEVEFIQPPLSDELVWKLHTVSNAWLESGKKEYTFSLGPFTENYIKHSEIALLRQGQKILAYVNVVPQFKHGLATVDHMRYTPEIPQEGMHFLLAELIKSLQAKGVKLFNLGFVPLSKLPEETTSINDKIALFLKHYGSRLYGFSGLEQFKNKFEPDWSPRFIVYEGGSVGLTRTLRALNIALTYRRVKLMAQPLLILAIFSSLAYCSFLAAHFISPINVSGSSLVSGLGQQGAPDNWFFNGFDVISGVLTIVIVVALRNLARLHRLWPYCLIALLLSAIGTIGAAFVELPAWFHETSHLTVQIIKTPEVFLHGFFSFLNTGGTCAAIIIWSVMQYKNKIYWRFWAGIGIVTFGLASLILGKFFGGLESPMQQIFIVMISTWFVFFIITALHRARYPAKSAY